MGEITDDKSINKLDKTENKIDSMNKTYQTDLLRPSTVTSTKQRPPSRPTGFNNQIYPTNQYPISYLSSQSPIFSYSIDHSGQEMRLPNKPNNQMQAHPISSTSTLTSPNLGIISNQQIVGTKVKSGFGMNQPPVAAAYVRSAPVTQIKRQNPGPPVKLKRADMYIATRQTKEDIFDVLPPAPPPPQQKRAFRQ